MSNNTLADNHALRLYGKEYSELSYDEKVVADREIAFFIQYGFDSTQGSTLEEVIEGTKDPLLDG